MQGFAGNKCKSFGLIFVKLNRALVTLMTFLIDNITLLITVQHLSGIILYETQLCITISHHNNKVCLVAQLAKAPEY